MQKKIEEATMSNSAHYTRSDGLRFNISFSGDKLRCSVCMMLVPIGQLDHHKCDEWWTEEASIKYIRGLFGETDIDFVVCVEHDRHNIGIMLYTACLPMDVENGHIKPGAKLFGVGNTYEDALTDICMKLIRLIIRSFFDKKKKEIDELFGGELL